MSARPTHWHEKSGSAVYPQGYPDDELALLPSGFWDAADRFEAVAAIKAEAARRIDAVAPSWRQSNDLAAMIAGNSHPEFEAAMRRRDEIDAIRRWSNEEEDKLA